MHHKTRWTEEKLAQRLELVTSQVYRSFEPIDAFSATKLPAPSAGPIVTPTRDNGEDWFEIPPDSYWGEWMTDYVLRSSFHVPEDWPRERPVALYLPIGEAGDFSHPEALVYIDGKSYAGCDRHHQEILLSEVWRDGATHELELHSWTGLQGWFDSDLKRKLFMRECGVVQIDQPTREFVATARVALGVVGQLEENSPAKGLLLNALDEAFKLIDIREPMGNAFYDSIPVAHAKLKAGVEAAGQPLDVDVVGVGHAHIDVAWLWTLGQTRRKSGRTFHTVLRLMEQFPDYKFTQSQPQLYDYLSEDYPDLLETIKLRVDEGRWEPTGGMWVEADCNLTGAESLARQFLLGRSYFEALFGKDVDTPILWLPDVFGYAWNLPQLIKQAGLEYFFTIKISWNQYNRMPFDSFWWQGIDGTKVLTHFSTTQDEWSAKRGRLGASTYNASATPQQVHSTWTNSQQKEVQQEFLMAYGYGDGGGGPTREMLENIREMENFPSTPRMRCGSGIEFFRNLEASAGDKLPTWNGELYFEYHRGTYTTQARNKRANRKSEFLLHDAEFLATVATLADENYAYPADRLHEAWKLVCLNQFHDIIPGSSITPVYTESLEQYDQVKRLGEGVRDGALQTIGRNSQAGLLLVNPTSFYRSDLAFIRDQLEDDVQLVSSADDRVLSQVVENGTLIALSDPIPPYSINYLKKEAKQTTTGLDRRVNATSAMLENDHIRVELNRQGEITRIFDKQQMREVLPVGEVANQFQAFEDRPMKWDAWDIDIFYDDKLWLADDAAEIRVVENGPLRAMVEVKKCILNSEITQRISLCYNSAQIRFDTTIDWQERHVLLKTAFPVDILSPKATYEIQWGHVERPTHRNTSWDWARFESCAQKWVDLSEGGYGVSLLNDCKYGHDIRDNVMRLTLLKGSTYPDPEADLGLHQFTYALLPHAGELSHKTVAAAYQLNDPLIVWKNDTGPLPRDPSFWDRPLFEVDKEGVSVIIETIKRAEDGRGVIVRLYECQRKRGKAKLNCAFDLESAWHTNLLEENDVQIAAENNSVVFPVKPFEIITLRLLPTTNAQT